MQDQELVLKIKERDGQAIQLLVSLYKSKVLNTCYRFLLNKEDAEDAAQEVFIEVVQSIDSFRGNSALSTWIYRIAVSKSLDEIKKRKRKKRISSIGRVLHLDEVVAWLTTGKGADAIIQEKQSLQQIYELLDQLPDNQRIAFTLSKIEGYTNTEIAEILKTSNSIVETYLYRAKVKLRSKLNSG